MQVIGPWEEDEGVERRIILENMYIRERGNCTTWNILQQTSYELFVEDESQGIGGVFPLRVLVCRLGHPRQAPLSRPWTRS